MVMLDINILGDKLWYLDESAHGKFTSYYCHQHVDGDQTFFENGGNHQLFNLFYICPILE